MSSRILALTAIPLFSASVFAQPSPIVQPRVAPRAAYTTTAGVTGAIPANRHWSQPISNGTSMFVFGGRTGTGNGSRRNDLYEFNATTLTWTQINADGDASAPPGRLQSMGAWDPIGNRIVIFGGTDAVGAYLGDTWTWDATNGWQDVTMPGGPSPRSQSSMAYDPVTTGLIMFGGQDSTGTSLNETWIFLGGTWSQLSPATSPPARSTPRLVTREAPYDDVFLCAGFENLPTPNRVHYTDVWRWDGATQNWVTITTSTPAVNAGVAGHVAVYDPIRERVVLTGGNGLSSNSAATGGAYGTEYGGSPCNWTSEFDCVTNEWKLYGAPGFNTGDPVIGRASRYYTAFIPATGKIYFWGGQNPSGIGASLTAMKEYQATTLAGTTAYGLACDNMAGTDVTLVADNAPWSCRDFNFTVSGLASGSLAATLIAFGQAAVPIPLDFVFPAEAGCQLLVDPIVASLPLNSASSSDTLTLPLADDPNAVGLPLNLQAVQIEGLLTWVSASNGLSVQIGLN